LAEANNAKLFKVFLAGLATRSEKEVRLDSSDDLPGSPISVRSPGRRKRYFNVLILELEPAIYEHGAAHICPGQAGTKEYFSCFCAKPHGTSN
jgi:hypothetical protein